MRFPSLPDTPGMILWICGTTGVGKSTVGWRVFEEVRKAGITAAFVDLEQISFYRPVPDNDPENHQIKAHNLAGLWQTFHESGARCLIVVGPINHADAIQTYTEVLPETSLRLCRLHAGSEQLRHRIRLRGKGLGPRIAGDELRGKPDTALQQITERAVETAQELQRNALGDLCIDTGNRSVEEVAQMILAEVDGGS